MRGFATTSTIRFISNVSAPAWPVTVLAIRMSSIAPVQDPGPMQEIVDQSIDRERRSSTARAPRPLKRGLCARPAGFRCRQEGHGTQAAPPRRYARPPVECGRASRRRAGSRWRPPSAADGAPSVPLTRAHLRGCRISGAEDGEGRCQYRLLTSLSCPSDGSWCASLRLTICNVPIAWISRNRVVWRATSTLVAVSATEEIPPRQFALADDLFCVDSDAGNDEVIYKLRRQTPKKTCTKPAIQRFRLCPVLVAAAHN